MFVYGRPHPDRSEESPPMSILNFDNLLGREHFWFLWMRMGREIVLPSLSTPRTKLKILEKTNLLIEWETGEMTWEPLSNIIADDPYSCAIYTK